MLLIGVFVGRPYCRFLCPYGVLLNLASRLSRWRVTITPSACVQCRLCEKSCPLGAIEVPSERRDGFIVSDAMTLLPVLSGCGARCGRSVAPPRQIP